MMLKKLNSAVLSLLVIAVAGCGGGSSSPTEPVTQPDNPTTPTTPTTPPQSAVELALENEDHSLATAQELIDFSLSQTRQIDENKALVVDELYKDLDSISWFPSHDSAFFESYLPALSFKVLSSTHHNNGDVSNVGLVMAGQQNQHRYAAMVANLMAVDVNDTTITFTKGLFAWLTDDENTKSDINIVTSHVPSKADSRYFQHNEKMRIWLDENYPDSYQINDAHRCDGALLLNCLQTAQPDILIVSDTDREDVGFGAIESAIEYAKAENIPILVSNYRRGPS